MPDETEPKPRPPLMVEVPTLLRRLHPERAAEADREQAKITGQPTRPENPFIGSIQRAVRERRDP